MGQARSMSHPDRGEEKKHGHRSSDNGKTNGLGFVVIITTVISEDSRYRCKDLGGKAVKGRALFEVTRVSQFFFRSATFV